MIWYSSQIDRLPNYLFKRERKNVVKKSQMMLYVTLVIALFMIGRAYIMNQDIKIFLLLFFTVGLGLALLRLFVNSSIRKMKGKSILTKILFFAVLLGFGLPFQAWFRKEVLFSMDSAYVASCITIMVVGVIFMTCVYNLFFSRNAKQKKQEITE